MTPLPFFCHDEEELLTYLESLSLARRDGDGPVLALPRFSLPEWERFYEAVPGLRWAPASDAFPAAARAHVGLAARTVLAFGAGRGTTTLLVALGRELAARGLGVGILELSLASPRLAAATGVTEPPPIHGDVLLPRFVDDLAVLSPAFFTGGQTVFLGGGGPRLYEVYRHDVLWGPIDWLLVEAAGEEAELSHVEALFAPELVLELGGYVERRADAIFLQCPPLDRPGLPYDPELRRGERPGGPYRAAVAELADRILSGPRGSHDQEVSPDHRWW